MIHTSKLLCLLIFLLPATLHAQTDWQSGYVVTNEGDTLKGMVRDRDTGNFGGLFDKVAWKGVDQRKGKRKRKTKFRPREIKAYQYGEARFVVLRTTEESKFLTTRKRIDEAGGQPDIFRVIAEGPLCLYHEEFTDEDNNMIDFVPYFKREGDPRLVRATQGVFGLKVKLLSEFFSDRPDLVRQLSEGTLQTPLEVVDAYGTGK